MAPVTAAHAALLGALLTALAINTTRCRMRGGRDPSPDAKEAILRASRAHGNTLEHGLPMVMLLLFAETQGASAGWICGLGTTFFVARAIYIYGMLTRPRSMPMRVGAGLTYALEIAAINLLVVRLLA